MTDSMLSDARVGAAEKMVTGSTVGRLDAFAEYIDARSIHKHILFMGAAAVIVLLYGYYLGSFDQSAHIPELKKFADATLYPGDAYLDLRFQHYSYFWLLFVPFYRLGLLDVTVFVVHLLVLYATVWAFWTLSDTLFDNPLTNLFSLTAFVLPHIGFGGWPLFEWSLLNRTFVMPFLLLAMILFLRGRIYLAFALLGLMANLHALSVTIAVALLLFAGLVEVRRIGWSKLAGALAIFIFFASPVLIWKQSGPGGDLTLNPAWFSVISLGFIYNNYVFFSTQPHIILATLSGFGTFGLFLIGRRAGQGDDNTRVVNLMMVAVALILVVQFVVATWLPVTLLVEMQLMRAGIWVTIFGLLYFSNYLATRYASNAVGPEGLDRLTFSYLFSLIPFVPMLVWFAERVPGSALRRQIIVFAVAVVPTVYAYLMILELGLAGPGIHVHPPQTDWNDVQFWARDHTSKQTVFITPPHIWWLFTTDWRVFSERSTVVTFSELLEISFAPNYLATWLHRIDELAPGAVAQFSGNPLENERIISRAFYSLSDDQLLKVACEYRAEYLVVEKPHTYVFDVTYENAGFRVYDLPLKSCKTASITTP